MEDKVFSTNKDQSITFKVNTAMKTMLIEKAKVAGADMSKYLHQIITDKFSDEAKAERQKQEKIKADELLKKENALKSYAALDKSEHESKLNFDHTPPIINKKVPTRHTAPGEPLDWKTLSLWGLIIFVVGLFVLLFLWIYRGIKNKANDKKYEAIFNVVDNYDSSRLQKAPLKS